MSDSRRSNPREDGSTGGRPNGGRAGDFQAALARLERAVQQLVGTARDEFSERATSLLDDTTSRLEQELGRRGRGETSSRGAASLRDRPPVTRALYRDPARGKIGGVCAGIALYYGLEPWVVRLIAVTALLFFPSIVFPAYWVAYFVMGRPPKNGSTRARRRHERGPRDDSSPAPELGPRLSPRHSLREVQADLTEVELRLRRMETHVTSGRYELQRELHKIDGGPRAVR
jgi:phage shock protein C